MQTANNSLDGARKERDSRPNITIASYQEERQKASTDLNSMRDERDARANITPQQWTTAQSNLQNVVNERDKAIQQRDERPNITNQEWVNAQAKINTLTDEVKRLNDKLTTGPEEVTSPIIEVPPKSPIT